MTVEFEAPVGYASVEAHLSMKLSLHMLVAGVVIGNAGHMAQQYTQGQRFQFKSTDDVIVTHFKSTVEFKVKTTNGAVKYHYDFHHRGCDRVTLYDAAGNAVDANPDLVQESYEALVDYVCAAVIEERNAYIKRASEAKSQVAEKQEEKEQ